MDDFGVFVAAAIAIGLVLIFMFWIGLREGLHLGEKLGYRAGYLHAKVGADPDPAFMTPDAPDRSFDHDRGA